MNELIPRIKALSEKHFEDVIEIRRHLHSNPELSFEEYETAGFIESKLREFGVSDLSRKAKTGITGIIEGKGPGKIIALRADIDALPILEENDVPYKSKNEGVMHACGHDVHTASLLGAIKILNELRDEFNGSVKFIFQPGEECVPGGASLLIKEGILKNPTPDKILGQHVMPQIEAGKVGFKKGMYMASADEIYFTIHGKGGHAAMPELAIDPIVITSQIIVALQQVVSRRANPKIPSVLSFGKVTGGTINNVIPDEVHVAGTFRTFDEDWRKEAHKIIETLVVDMAKSMGATCDFEIKKGYPFLTNDEPYTEKNILAAKKYLGAENVVDLDLWMAAEDFAYYSQEMEACFYRLGTGNQHKGIVSGVHTPTFDIDEEALKLGVGLMSWLAINELEG